MTGDRSRLKNFVKKFIGTVRLGNDHFSSIMGYGDYVIGDSVISRVYYVEGLGHNLFSVKQFYDSDLEVAFSETYLLLFETGCLPRNKSWVMASSFTITSEHGHINDLAKKDLVSGEGILVNLMIKLRTIVRCGFVDVRDELVWKMVWTV
ncbi:hypothetical protein Tco_0989264 [Tanacetum coccineum]|uniref:Retrovirus-related Pol polyprotein from transposon TNT 1-94-like beta-barrel domain-containing protein n=1 Tax=Tanacetum coccineum TaxID=301880 RepID=A0ABQ5EUA2_9ASTR